MKKLGKFGMLFLVAVLAVGAVTAAGAYFSSSQTVADRSFTSGTLTLGSPEVMTWTAPDKWAPGDTAQLEIKLTNTGSIDATYLAIDWTNPKGYTAFANVIQVTELWEKVGGTWQDSLAAPQYYHKLVENEDDTFTLRELMESYIKDTEPLTSGGYWNEFGYRVGHLTDAITGNGYDWVPSGTPAIAAGGEYRLKMVFKFLESAGDDYQGKTFSFDISFLACQDYMSQAP